MRKLSHCVNQVCLYKLNVVLSTRNMKKNRTISGPQKPRWQKLLLRCKINAAYGKSLEKTYLFPPAIADHLLETAVIKTTVHRCEMIP